MIGTVGLLILQQMHDLTDDQAVEHFCLIMTLAFCSSDEKQLSLLTHVAIESADRHDTNAFIPALERLQYQDMVPEELLADSLYGSESNCEQGRKEYDVEVVSPAMPGNRRKIHLAEFMVDHQGWGTSCPEGINPVRVKKNTGCYSAAFVVDVCGDYPIHSANSLRLCSIDKIDIFAISLKKRSSYKCNPVLAISFSMKN